MVCGSSGLKLFERLLNSFLFALAAISVIWFSYQYIKKCSIHNKCLHYMTLIFFGFILITNILWCISCAVHCSFPNLWYILLVSGFGFYGFQYLFLLLLLFHRLCVVFHGSSLAVCIKSKIIFYGGYVMFGIVMIITGVLPLTDTWHFTLTTIGLFITLTIIGLLVGLFIYKLLKLSRMAESTNQQTTNANVKLLFVCTKSFILTLVSIASFLLVGVISNSVFEGWIGDEIHYQFVRSLIFVLDLETNFICVLFGFQPFETYYTEIFGRCQRKTVACFARIVPKNVDLQLVNSQSPQSSPRIQEETAATFVSANNVTEET